MGVGGGALEPEVESPEEEGEKRFGAAVEEVGVEEPEEPPASSSQESGAEAGSVVLVEEGFLEEGWEERLRVESGGMSPVVGFVSGVDGRVERERGRTDLGGGGQRRSWLRAWYR